ncbi:MAG: hypothetical protein PVF97_03120 [Desulfobacterales bacterium]|jgi:hypothetical protein
MLLTIAGCATFGGGGVDFDPADQIFEVPAHDPTDADQTSRYYLIKNGSRVTVSRDYPSLPIAERTVIVEVWVYRYDTDGDGRYDLWRKEFDYPEVTIVHPDGRRLINPPYREVKLYVGVRKAEKGNGFVFRRVLIDRYDAGRRLGADGIFEEQHVRPAGKLRPDDFETAL